MILISTTVSAQDHLIPSDSKFNSDNKANILNSSLLWGFPKKATVRYIVKSAFDANYAFVIIKDSLKYVIKLLLFTITKRKRGIFLFILVKERSVIVFIIK